MQSAGNCNNIQYFRAMIIVPDTVLLVPGVTLFISLTFSCTGENMVESAGLPDSALCLDTACQVPFPAVSCSFQDGYLPSFGGAQLVCFIVQYKTWVRGSSVLLQPHPYPLQRLNK